MQKLAYFIAIAGLIGPPAFAADMAVKAPPPAPAPPQIYNWTGFYIGGVGSYGWSHSEHCDANTCALPGEVYPDFDMKGWLGGATLGVNWQWLNWVVGVEGDWSGGK